MDAVKIKNLSKSYIKSTNPFIKFYSAINNRAFKQKRFMALDDISFSIKKGEAFGIIGKNGSGKSTLLKILAGISHADKGTCETDGKVSALLELGAGFNPEYSGIENIYLNGTLNGYTHQETKKHISDIIEFADIDESFLYLPVKTYSSGMLIRLAFSAMIFPGGDIILVDEALAVGDIKFRAKCYQKFDELKKIGKTIIFVSHDIDAIRRFCTKAMWLDDGKIREIGDTAFVTSRYMQNSVSCGTISDFSDGVINRYGSHIGCIKSSRISKSIFALGEMIHVYIDVLYPKGAKREYLGVSLSVKDGSGLDLAVFQTSEKLKHGINHIEFKFKNVFNIGEYFISVGVEDRENTPISYYEYTEGAMLFKSTPDMDENKEHFGLFIMPHEIKISSD